MLIHQDNPKRGVEPVGAGWWWGGALPVLRMLGSVPGRFRMGSDPQSSWLGVPWWEFSHPRGAQRGGGRGSFSEVLGEPRNWLKQNPGGGEVERHEGQG